MQEAVTASENALLGTDLRGRVQREIVAQAVQYQHEGPGVYRSIMRQFHGRIAEFSSAVKAEADLRMKHTVVDDCLAVLRCFPIHGIDYKALKPAIPECDQWALAGTNAAIPKVDCETAIGRAERGAVRANDLIGLFQSRSRPCARGNFQRADSDVDLPLD